jgi:N-acetylmuramoyl-L-alanine amidase
VNPKSGQYGKTMLLASSIAARLKGQKLPVEVVDHSMSYILRENKRPALLIECGNLDDADNIALLKDEVRTETLCRNILSGIVDYNTRSTK